MLRPGRIFPGRTGHVRAGPGGPGRAGSRVAGRSFRPGSRVAGHGSATPRDPANPALSSLKLQAGCAWPVSPRLGLARRALNPKQAETCDCAVDRDWPAHVRPRDRRRGGSCTGPREQQRGQVMGPPM